MGPGLPGPLPNKAAEGRDGGLDFWGHLQGRVNTLTMPYERADGNLKGILDLSNLEVEIGVVRLVTSPTGVPSSVKGHTPGFFGPAVRVYHACQHYQTLSWAGVVKANGWEGRAA